MKKSLKKIIAFMLTVAMLAGCVPVFSVADYSADDVWEYTPLDTIVDGVRQTAITGYNGDETDVVIPSEIDGYTITTIGGWVFENTEVEYVTIPDTVTEITSFALESPTITGVYIPAGVTQIDLYSLGYHYDDESSGEVAPTDGFTITGAPGSAAQTYAEENGIEFIPTEGDDEPDETYYFYGDVNYDGKITISDAYMALLAAEGLETLSDYSLICADVVADGELNAVDARLILKVCAQAEPVSILGSEEALEEYGDSDEPLPPVNDSYGASYGIYDNSMNCTQTNDELTVTLSGRGIAGLMSSDLEFSYDSDLLEFKSIEACENSGIAMSEGCSPNEGTVTFSFLYMREATEDADLCTITFKVLKFGYADISCRPYSCMGISMHGVSISVRLNEPISEEPVSEEPVPDEPILEEPISEEPVSEEPVSDEPILEEPISHEPVSGEPSSKEEPFTGEPSSKEEPSTGEPSSKEEPSTGEPSSKDEPSDNSLILATDGGISVDSDSKLITIEANNKNASLTLRQLKALIGNEFVRFIDKDSNELGDDALVGTGARVQVLDKNGNVLSEYTVLVPSDVNGDGKTTAADARLALRTSAKLETTQGVFAMAADMNSDNNITAADARKILRKSANLD